MLLWNEPAASHTVLFSSSFNLPSLPLTSAKVKVSKAWGSLGEGWKVFARGLEKDEGTVVMAVGKTKGQVKLKKLLTTLTCCFSPSLILGKVLKGCKLINLI